MPASYKPRSDYGSAQELADALSLEPDSVLALDLTQGVVHERHKATISRDKKRSANQHKKKMEMSFFVHSPTQLFQLMHLAKRRRGTRQIAVDGTRGICQLLTTLIVVGAVSVRYRKQATGKEKVTSSMRPIAFVHAAGERHYVYVQTLCELRRLSMILFGIDFEIDWGTSDHATAFVHAHLQFNDSPHMCDDTEWETNTEIEDGLVVKPEATTSLETLDGDNEEGNANHNC